MTGRDSRRSASVGIVCSDIDTKVLTTAGACVYDADCRGLSPERLKRHFLRGTGRNAGRIRVKPELARLVEFRSFNLTSTHWTTLGDAFDLVFCRNVMIYFDAPTQRQVLQRTHAAMRPGGSVRRPTENSASRALVPAARQDRLRARLRCAPRQPAVSLRVQAAWPHPRNLS